MSDRSYSNWRNCWIATRHVIGSCIPCLEWKAEPVRQEDYSEAGSDLEKRSSVVWRSVFEHTPNPSMVLKETGDIMHINHAMLDFLGGDKISNVEGLHVRHIVAGDTEEELQARDEFLTQFSESIDIAGATSSLGGYSFSDLSVVIEGSTIDRAVEIEESEDYTEIHAIRSRQSHSIGIKALNSSNVNWSSCHCQRLRDCIIVVCNPVNSFLLDRFSQAADQHVMRAPFGVIEEVVLAILSKVKKDPLQAIEEKEALLANYDSELVLECLDRLSRHILNRDSAVAVTPVPVESANLLRPVTLKAEEESKRDEHARFNQSVIDSLESIEDVAEANFDQALKGVWVVCADDDKVPRRLMNRMLGAQEVGASSLDIYEEGSAVVRHVIEYIEGLEKEHGSLEDFPMGLIALDKSMPHDGITTTDELVTYLNAKGIRGKVVIMGITADSRQEDLSQFTVAGANLALSKPVKIGDIQRGFANYSMLS
ncbi:MAG: PAS domain-containing protein [Chlamydiales bacterium]|nr:PAS domain-containing protein [Chlamydiales bacterium]